MKLSITLAVVALALYTSCATSRGRRDCKEVKTGTFRSYLENGSAIWIWRSDTLQLETVVGKADTMKLKVRWKDPCTYNLTFLNTSAAGVTFDAKIVKVKKAFYVYEVTTERTGTFRDTMYVIR